MKEVSVERKVVVAAKIKAWRASIRNFVKDKFGLDPQPCKPAYKKQFDEICALTGKDWEQRKHEVKADWFGDPVDPKNRGGAWKWHQFVKGTHYTWQQNLILIGVEKAQSGHAKPFLSIVSGHGIGKANSYNMMFDTPQGRRRWGDIVPGDFVFGASGEPTQVVATHHFADVPMYRVMFDDRSSCEVSSGHLWNVRGRQERRKKLDGWRTIETIDLAQNVKRKNGIVYARQWEIPAQGMAQFDEQKTALHPYLVGVWIGDGTKSEPEYTKPYAEIAERLRSFGYEIHSKGSHSYRIQKHAKDFRGGVFDLNSNHRFIPDEYKYNSIENRMALFEGLCDSDGEVNQSGSIGYSTTSKQLAEDVIWLARSLGCKAIMQPKIKKTWYSKNGKRIAGKDCYRVTINAPFNPFTLKHRKDVYKPSEHRYLTRWIESIEPIANADGMCITVEAQDGLYLANDFIVTHNSTVCSWIILWFLYVHYMSQVAATAPTSYQMHDVLWKELSKWINMLGRTSPMDQDFFRWTAEYVRVCHAPNEWFARARTSSKENTEALAGVHADEGVGIVIDEASGVPNQVFNTVEGALTSGNVFLVMISNGTEITGYFYDSHHSNKDLFQIFKFDGEESPMVDREYIKRKSRHGLHSDEYRIRVKGEFPREGGMSDGGFMQLIPIDRINVSVENEVRIPLVGRKILALDPAGEGKDKAVWVCRNKFRAKQVSELLSSNDASMAEETIRLAVLLGIWPEDIVCGAFGVGADVGKKIALATALGINAGDISEIVGYQINPDTDNPLHRRYMTKRPWEIYTIMEGNTPETEEKYNGQFFRRTMDEVTDPNGGEPGQSYSTYRAVEYTDIYTNIRALMYFRARSWIYQGGLIVDNDQAENSQFAYELSQIMYKRALHGNKIQLEPKKDMKKRGVKSPNIGDAFALSMLRDLTEAKKYTAEEVEELTARDRVVGDDRFNAL